jgi:uncharacterized protein
VLSGEVLFEVVSEHGEDEVVAKAPAGALVGYVAAFTGRPTSAAARVDREAVVLAIPVERLADAIREAPEVGVQLVHALASVHGRQAISVDDEAALPPADEADDPPPAPAPPEGTIPIEGAYNDAHFFIDTMSCPVSGTRFQYLRVRTRAVRPTSRESDFHVRYSEVNPTWYGVVVCPGCGYAAYHDDFTTPGDESVRRRLWDERAARVTLAPEPLTGVRTAEDAVVALTLAMRCYEARDTSDSRRALLLHRRAWLERDAGDTAEERVWLQQARDAYERAYQSDVSLSEESATRIAYLVGDLAFRLDDLPGAAQWLETATRGGAKATAGIVRTARERLQDVRDLMKRERLAS